jgi:Xaa-Pro aminopeptidase
MWLYLREALPEAKLIEARDLMFEVRLCPSEEELEWYRKGARFCDLAFEAAVDAARPGMKEYELVGVIHGTYLRHGGSLYGAALGVSPMQKPVDSLLLVGRRGSTRELQPGHLILTEITGKLAVKDV